MGKQDNYEQIRKSAKTRRTAGKAVTYFFLVIWAVVVLFPFYWMVLTSVKEEGAYNF